MIIRIPEKPLPLKRARAFLRGGKIFFYNSQHKEIDELQLYVKSILPKDFKVYEKPLRVIFDFFLPIPKSTAKKARENMLFVSKKPDLSNLIKYIEDALNGILWKDDSLIVDIRSRKFYSDSPYTLIKIYEDF